MPQYRIWDLHCHLLNVAGRTPEEKMATLLEIADRHGIERLCLFFSSTWSKTPTPDELKTDNDVVMQAMSHWANRTHGFCYVSGEHVEFMLSVHGVYEPHRIESDISHNGAFQKGSAQSHTASR